MRLASWRHERAGSTGEAKANLFLMLYFDGMSDNRSRRRVRRSAARPRNGAYETRRP